MTQTITTERICQTCNGTGTVPHIVAGTLCGIGGGTQIDVRCGSCKGTGWVEVAIPAPTLAEKLALARAWGDDELVAELEDAIRAEQMESGTTPAPAGTLTVGGCTVVAPGFVSAAQFDAAVHRAYCEGLTVKPAATRGAVMVSNPTTRRTYLTTRTTCTCPAGRQGRACKHQSFAIHLSDVCGIDLTKGRQQAA